MRQINDRGEPNDAEIPETRIFAGEVEAPAACETAAKLSILRVAPWKGRR